MRRFCAALVVVASGAVPSLSFTPIVNGIYTVALTATDDDGDSGTNTQTILVSGAGPTATIVGAPASSLEGIALPLTSEVIDPVSVDTLVYAWSVTKNEVAYPTGTPADNQDFVFTPDDDGTYVVTLVVRNEQGNFDITTSTIVVGNTAPSVSITGPGGSPIPTSATPGSLIHQNCIGF